MGMQRVIEHVVSADGTRIAYQRSGTGPSLVLVHGAATDHTRWRSVAEHLDPHFTVYAMDRRGRSESGDTEEYSFEHEIEDVAALANSIDGPVNLYGHSGGATFVLEAAPRIANLGRLVLYEGIFPGSSLFPEAVVDRLEELLNDGDHEGVVITFMREVPRMPEHEIDHLRSLPQEWSRRVVTAPTLPRELRGMNDYRFRPERFADTHVPTLLLVGSESPEIFKQSAELVQSTLSNARVRELPGQEHLADIMAPEMVAGALIDFLLEE
jgi:pimeloyl-ACP methyl ester carboxylesterase